jgi:hypothetical protein
MVITTAVEVFPSVTGADGAKRHCAPLGSPLEQESVTVPANEEPNGFGATVSWYAPLVVCPALRVWLGVAEVTEKSGITVSGNCNAWLGCPDESATVRLMLYVRGVMVLGTLTVTNRLDGAFALIATGLVGVTRHCPEMVLASQLALIEPM